MSNNSDFARVTVEDVELQWPRLDQTYRYNSQDKQTEPCAPTVQGAGWSQAWLMENGEAKKFFEGLRAHYEACAARNSKLPVFGGVFGMKKLEDEQGNLTGYTQFTAKKRAMSNEGKPNKPIKVVGADRKELEDKAIWSGSRGGVSCLAFPTTDPEGKGGISLLLDAVIVTNPVYGGDNIEDIFGPAQTPTQDFADELAQADAESAPQPKAEAVPAGAAGF